MRRLVTALLLAPSWAAVLVAAWAALFRPPPSFMGNIDKPSWIGMAALTGAIIGYAAMLVIGLPSHAWLKRRGRSSLAAYLLTWFALAVIVWLIVFTVSFVRDGLVFSLSYLAETIIYRPYVPLSLGLMWALVGTTFWVIVRPDR